MFRFGKPNDNLPKRRGREASLVLPPGPECLSDVDISVYEAIGFLSHEEWDHVCECTYCLAMISLIKPRNPFGIGLLEDQLREELKRLGFPVKYPQQVSGHA